MKYLIAVVTLLCGVACLVSLGGCGQSAGPSPQDDSGLNAITPSSATSDQYIPSSYPDSPLATAEGKPPSPSLPAGYTAAFMRPDSRNVFQICVMTGSKVTQVTATGRNTDNAHPTWSPPGVSGGPYICFRSVRDGNSGLYRMKPDGSGVTQLTEGPDRVPDWSPTGDRIAFIRDLGQLNVTHLMVLDVGQGTVTEIALQTPQGSASLYWPTFSPDGATIAFTLIAGGADTPAGIYTVPVAGGPLTTVALFSNPNYHESLDWCRSRIGGGHSLIVAHQVYAELYTVEMDEDNVLVEGSRRTIYGASPELGGAAWSWDGRYLGAHTSTASGVLYYLNADGTGATSLVTGSLMAWKP